MSTLQLTSSALPAERRAKTTPGRLARWLERWSKHRAETAQRYVDQYLQQLGDQQLKELGKDAGDIARIRAAKHDTPRTLL